MNTDTELKRATESLTKIILTKIRSLEESDVSSKEIKELTGIVKDLSSIERSLSDESAEGEIRVIFEGGDVKWAQ